MVHMVYCGFTIGVTRSHCFVAVAQRAAPEVPLLSDICTYLLAWLSCTAAESEVVSLGGLRDETKSLR